MPAHAGTYYSDTVWTCEAYVFEVHVGSAVHVG